MADHRRIHILACFLSPYRGRSIVPIPAACSTRSGKGLGEGSPRELLVERRSGFCLGDEGDPETVSFT